MFTQCTKGHVMFCYVLAGVVGCVQSIHGQARRVLVRRDPVSQGRYDPARVARIGVAGKARFVELGLGELRLGKAGLAGRAGFVDFGLGPVR